MSASPALRVALLGRPNSGKSSLYNALTGGRAKVGNFPGITVDILEATVELPGGRAVRVFDLPGLYSLEAILDPTTDEGVARAFIEEERSSSDFAVLQVIDATQLALGLRFTRELGHQKLPMLLVVTQMDLLEADGRSLDPGRLEALLGVPVIALSTRRPDARALLLGALDSRTPTICRPDIVPEAVAREVLANPSGPRSPASGETRRARFTRRTDALLLHPVLGPALFLGLMAALFSAVFLVADPASTTTDALVNLARGKIAQILGAGLLTSFLADGLLAGAGTVLAFMPQIVLLTVGMELLEATGYLARGAFLVDRVLRALGLSGRSFVPLLMGHACAVPAIAATRIVRDPRERLTAILVLPLMTCSARLPTYALLISTFFSGRSALLRAGIFVALYAAGVLSGLLASLALRRTVTRGRSLPFVLEMPSYRAPQLRVVLSKARDAAIHFAREVGTTIVVVSAVLWVLLKVPAPEGVRAPGASSPIEQSIGATIGRAVEPITRPAGFDWRINVGLIGSFGAREVMVGTLGVIFGLEDLDDKNPAPLAAELRQARHPDGTPAYTAANALAILAFFVVACQCTSTVAAVRRETKSLRWPAFVLAYSYGAGYVLAVLVYQAARALGG